MAVRSGRFYLPCKPVLNVASLGGLDDYAELASRYKASHVKLMLWWLTRKCQVVSDTKLEDPSFTFQQFGANFVVFGVCVCVSPCRLVASWPLTTGTQAPYLVFSGIGFLRPACGTAISSVCISISVWFTDRSNHQIKPLL